MPEKYKITPTPEERRCLEQVVRSGKTPARTPTPARVPLKADHSEGRGGWRDEQTVEAPGVGRATAERIRRRFVERGFEAALYSRRPGRRYPHKLDGEAEAPLVAAACGPPPGGARAGRSARSPGGSLRRAWSSRSGARPSRQRHRELPELCQIPVASVPWHQIGEVLPALERVRI